MISSFCFILNSSEIKLSNRKADSKWNVASEAVKDNREWEENERGEEMIFLETKNPACGVF
jgi:hypothetical protein